MVWYISHVWKRRMGVIHGYNGELGSIQKFTPQRTFSTIHRKFSPFSPTLSVLSRDSRY